MHRQNVASVVIRLLNSHTTANDSVVCKDVSLALQQTIAMELQQVIHVDVKAQRRKRKRNKSSSSDIETTLVCRPLGSFAADDVQILAQVLKRVSVYTLPLLDDALSGLARDLAQQSTRVVSR